MTERKVEKDVKDGKQSRPCGKGGIGAMDIILIIVGIALLAFTAVMIVIFWRLGSEPGTLITCFYATLGGECGIMGWIKTSKEKAKRDRDGGEE